MPPQVLTAPGMAALNRLAGYVSVNVAPVKARAFELDKVIVSVLVAPTVIVAGVKLLATVGEETANTAVAAVPVPPLVVVTGPVLFR